MTKRKHVPILRPEVEVRPIPGYEGLYSASRDGRVWSHPKATGKSRHGGRWLRPAVNRRYPVVSLSNGERMTMMSVHRAVALAWLPNPYGLPEVNHDDGSRGNCNVGNLEWCSVQRNRQHAYDTGLNPGRGSLSDAQIREVVAARAAGEKLTTIASRYGVSTTTVCAIARGRRKLALLKTREMPILLTAPEVAQQDIEG